MIFNKSSKNQAISFPRTVHLKKKKLFTWSKIIPGFGSIEKSLKSDIGEIIYLMYCRINKSRKTTHTHSTHAFQQNNKIAELFFINILESHWEKVFLCGENGIDRKYCNLLKPEREREREIENRVAKQQNKQTNKKYSFSHYYSTFFQKKK